MSLIYAQLVGRVATYFFKQENGYKEFISPSKWVDGNNCLKKCLSENNKDGFQLESINFHPLVAWSLKCTVVNKFIMFREFRDNNSNNIYMCVYFTILVIIAKSYFLFTYYYRYCHVIIVIIATCSLLSASSFFDPSNRRIIDFLFLLQPLLLKVQIIIFSTTLMH